MATLTGQTIAATYDALLKVTDNGPITSSLKLITDGLGNNTALSLSSVSASITGTLSVTSTIGASNLSGTNTGDETNATIKTKLGAASASQDGYLTSTDWSTFNNKVPVSRTLTINGTSYDLSADRSWTVNSSQWTTSGSNIYYNTGNVGIGTASPSVPLHIYNSASILAYFESTNSNGANVSWRNSGTIIGDVGSGASVGSGSASDFSITSRVGSILILGTASSERMRIDGLGRVGIGTSSPQVKFHTYASIFNISDESTYSARFSNGSNKGVTIGYDTTNNKGHIGSINPSVAWTDLILNANGGNIGIGTSTPSVKLDVSGAGLFSSSVTASSFIKSGGTSAQLLAGDGSVVTAGTNITISGGTISSSGGLSGSGTTNYVPKFTGSSAIGNSQIFDNGTNVGIGTTSPLFSSFSQLTVNGTQGGLTIQASSTGISRLFFAKDDSSGVEGLIRYAHSDNSMQLFTAATERMRITSAGNVGIGTSSPGVKLDVIGALNVTSDSTEQIVIKTLTNTNRQLLIGYNYTPNYSYIQAVEQGIAYRNLILQQNGGNVGIGTTSPASRLSVWEGEITISNLSSAYTAPMGSIGAYNADATNGGLIFKTSLSGTLAEKVRIQNNGYVGIGTTTPAVLLDINSSTTNDRLVLSHTGSPKCVFGVTSAGANFLYHHTTGTFPIYINAAGNFGINTASPNEKLSVIGAISANNGMIVQGYSAAASGLNVEMGVTSGYAQFNSYNRTTSAYGQFRLDGSTLLLNAGSGGNVGIGTTSPSSKFHVWNGGIKTTGFPSAGNPFNFLESNYNDSAVTVRFQNINPTNGYDADLGIQLMNTSASIVDVLRIKGSTGNVGIGTNSPSYKLDVAGSARITSTTLIQYGGADTWFGYGGSYDNYFSTPNGGKQVFRNGSSEIMTLTSTGNVGIGTSSPSYLLHAKGSGSYNGAILADNSSTTGAGSFQVGQNGTAKGSLSLSGTFNGDTSSDISLFADTGFGVRFYTNGVNERVRIASDGRFQVNNTGYSSNCTATLRALSSTGTDRILECITIGYSSAFYVQTNGSYFFAGSNLSDARTKKDINYLEESILDKVMKLKPASFRYKENEENIKGGFIAQDIKEIFPDLVTATKSDDEMMGVDYYGVIAILTKAIQEQQVQIEELKAKLK